MEGIWHLSSEVSREQSPNQDPEQHRNFSHQWDTNGSNNTLPSTQLPRDNHQQPNPLGRQSSLIPWLRLGPHFLRKALPCCNLHWLPLRKDIYKCSGLLQLMILYCGWPSEQDISVIKTWNPKRANRVRLLSAPRAWHPGLPCNKGGLLARLTVFKLGLLLLCVSVNFLNYSGFH